MLEYFEPNSCVASVQTTIGCMSKFGLSSREIPVKFLFELPELGQAYAAGLSVEELSTASFVKNIELDGESWRGHLVAIVEDAWLVDPSFDQALFHMCGAMEPSMLIYRLDKIPPNFRVEFGATFMGGASAKITYVTTDNRGYIGSSAWDSVHLEPLVNHICAKMLMAE